MTHGRPGNDRAYLIIGDGDEFMSVGKWELMRTQMGRIFDDDMRDVLLLGDGSIWCIGASAIHFKAKSSKQIAMATYSGNATSVGQTVNILMRWCKLMAWDFLQWEIPVQTTVTSWKPMGYMMCGL